MEELVEEAAAAEPIDPAHLRPEVERWLVRQGLPHFIEGYSATGDILTRAVPFLSLIMIGELALSFGDQARGVAQLGAFLGGVAVLVGAVVAVNRLRGRRPFQRPDRVGPLEIAVFVLVPPIVVWEAGHGADRAALLVGGQLAILLVVYLATSYGVVPMTRWALRSLERQLTELGTLVGKALPLMMVFSTFLFLNTEMWQVMDDMALRYYVVAIGLVIAVASASILLSLRREVDTVVYFERWSDVYDACRRSPVSGLCPRDPDAVAEIVPLRLRARVNVELLAFVSRGIVVVLVSLCVFAFYVLFGLLTVREETISGWVGDSTRVIRADAVWQTTWFGPRILLSKQLLLVSGFIACFAGLQFTVSLLSDPAARAEFRADMAAEIREALAVRAVYLDALCPNGDERAATTGPKAAA